MKVPTSLAGKDFDSLPQDPGLEPHLRHLPLAKEKKKGANASDKRG